jgi:lipopolysaccharide transport system permease protein
MVESHLRALWYYRGFILGSVKREFQSRYRNSMLGGLWTILQPLSNIFIYIVIFSQIMKARLQGTDDSMAYGIYLCSGVLTWGLFAEIVNRCQTVFLENANLIKKLSFPRICLPVIVILNASITFVIGFGLFFSVLIVLGKFPGWVIWALPVVLVIEVLFATGLGIILGIINVFFRDVGQFTGIVLQFWFWFTPIVYPLTILSKSLQSIITFNPMTSIIMAYQSILVYRCWPQWKSMAPTALIAGLLCVMGIYLYRKRSGEIVDEL